MGEVRYMISEAAKQVDVESHALRYWEDELGLSIGRTEMGHRYYTKDDIQLFLCIKKLKDNGMLLRELKPLIPELLATRAKVAESVPPEFIRNAAQNTLNNTLAGTSRDPEAAFAKDSTGKSVKNSVKSTAENSPGDSSQKSTSKNPIRNTAKSTTANTAQSSTKPAAAGNFVNSAPDNTALPAKHRTDSGHLESTERPFEVITDENLKKMRSLIGEVVGEVVNEAITDNNIQLKKDITQTVTSDVVREMGYLLQAKERREEEHFRKMDCLIRQQQAHRKESVKRTPLVRLRDLLT
ncbi:DNA-binding transcriptional regulator, MerR family [Hespellia stercorisuis DSM 15480]|uniref:DNA-binding transcriptional regulator, MerR family n=1 Tax=Hespellia stercorisuis DSM 15480 TaxID=1121950 RepID=A0A1M6RB11_9FIRM|nr:helix-turn-helix domain-containing protein [Hespellia stercorisuis]SHK29654.1 DNA-binding transcriptional regulator, MerR family [Hespellia stercorisuis DSM 15480]